MTMKEKKVPVFVCVICSLLASVLFLGIGYFKGLSASGGQTFYATIADLGDSYMTVRGIEENDINFRGDFRLSVDEDIEIMWRHTDIGLEDLEPGDRISVTFKGGVEETSPAGLEDVTQILLLEDEL